MKDIAQGSLDVVHQAVADPEKSQEILEQSFRAALKGIQQGKMTYDEDPILPILQSEMDKRIQHFKGLSAEEEGRLLSLTPEQRRIIADQDRK